MLQIGEYIQNHLPIRLLHVPDMTIMGRNDLQSMVNNQIERMELELWCGIKACGCFEKIREQFKYAILSHRWGDREVTFTHFQLLQEELVKSETAANIHEKIAMLLTNPNTDAPSEASLSKLANFLSISAQKQCKYAWSDTVCINKESSAELDESIRSMYAWYRDSRICIVYLNETTNHVEMEQDPWFTRGWTLQELLAPQRLAFYSKKWEQITRGDSIKRSLKEPDHSGPRHDPTHDEFLWPRISAITKIDVNDLLDFKPGLFDIRKRMTWASERKTTRIEDMAYCLIGIFDISLPIAYGEKEKAFYRLQVEILQNSDDMGLFDWQGRASTYSSMLAASPLCFSRYFGHQTDRSLRFDGDPTFAQTNIGIRMPLVIYQVHGDSARPLLMQPEAAPWDQGFSAKSGSYDRWVENNKLHQYDDRQKYEQREQYFRWHHYNQQQQQQQQYNGPQQYNPMEREALPPAASAFSILGASSRPGYHIILVLGAGDRPRQYRRLEVIERKVHPAPSNRVPEIVFIK